MRPVRLAIMPLEARVALLVVGFGRDADGKESRTTLGEPEPRRVTSEPLEQSDQQSDH